MLSFLAKQLCAGYVGFFGFRSLRMTWFVFVIGSGDEFDPTEVNRSVVVIEIPEMLLLA
ncbi:hypothetical protein Ctha_0413 [Chloroherpeton thalassium ATCC 35110]|uniref:Uncharacterized protein n=1 Tax=Chloroherpeton thalassium (strain ATCC 35110 / GB-78) TaxID=517418 RepID=B3QUH8_CHLT3|nr:hypothetical protein Ctha_0413 [Chloroherpeton thalassium ATCC 35110]